MHTPQSLGQLYHLMSASRALRAKMVQLFLNTIPVPATLVDELRLMLHALESIPRMDGQFHLCAGPGRAIPLDLAYEIGEIEKDLIFFEHGEAALYSHFEKLHNDFRTQVDSGITMLSNKRFSVFLTDRDGTIVNYCARYVTSVQSAYNAIFLTRFIRSCSNRSIIITSGPLRGGGITDISVMPPGICVYAGSKGREYMDENGTVGALSIQPQKQAKLDELSTKLTILLSQPHYRKFGLVGSGLQKKFGQITVARQDINGSISDEESNAFLACIVKLVAEVDADGTCFRMVDTGMDIEIILTVNEDSGDIVREFDKSDAVAFLEKALNLDLAQVPILVCGDTSSDIPMIHACIERSEDTWIVFVTSNTSHKREVAGAATRPYLFVDNPDILITILHELSKQRT